MNPLDSLKRLRKARRLYNDLVGGETTILVEFFPFVKLAFTPPPVEPPPELPSIASVQPSRLKPKPKPTISYRSRSEEDDLRDALDVGFGKLTFDVSNGTGERPNIKKLGEQ